MLAKELRFESNNVLEQNCGDHVGNGRLIQEDLNENLCLTLACMTPCNTPWRGGWICVRFVCGSTWVYIGIRETSQFGTLEEGN